MGFSQLFFINPKTVFWTNVGKIVLIYKTVFWTNVGKIVLIYF